MMRHLSFLITLLGVFFSVQAQTTEIHGVAKQKKVETVRLFKVVSGRLEEIASARPAENGAFNFKFQPSYQGYYVIGKDGRDDSEKFRLYVKGNDEINLELNDSTYLLKGINNKENQALSAWQKLAFKVERRSVYFMPRIIQGFFPQHQALVNNAKTWLIGKETGNRAFDELMKITVEYDLAYFALAFVSSSRASQPSLADYNTYLKNFKADPFLQSDKLLQFPYGTIMLRNLVSFKNQNLRGPNLEIDVPSIANDTLKGEFILGTAATLKSYTSYSELINKYEKYFLTDDQKLRVKKLELNLAKFKPGADAINFTYPDVSGKLVSLSDFKGKVVLVDVWATWCGPCIKEIPYLKALEKQLHGKDVVFLSVSVDEKKDEGKWKKFIIDSELGGVQLLAGGGGSPISRAYYIVGIPRFMLFDKDGKIIDVDCPRPSDPKLKEVIGEYLVK